MLFSFARRMLAEPDKRCLWKFLYNCGYKGMRSVQQFKRRLRRGVHFPPFLFLSIINSCQLRCQGCWVDVAAPRQMIALEDLKRIIDEAKQQGNRFFGILGGEPLLHPHLLDLLAAYPDCYFQIFTNGHLIDDALAERFRRLANATLLISIEGSEVVSDVRRGRPQVFSKSLEGLAACVRHGLIVGVATSVCQTNIDLVSEAWLRRLIELGVHYAWFYTYRPIGPAPNPELALSPEQVLQVRRFVVDMRSKLPIALIDAYWDDQGQGLCPMVTGISHHIGPSGAIEPCPIIQFAKETIHDGRPLAELFAQSEFLRDFRATSGAATRGCVILERPDLVQQLVEKHGAFDTTQRGTSMAELLALQPRGSQHNPGQEIPETHWAYRFAKRHWFFGFGAYS